jgi:hypothetical protein
MKYSFFLSFGLGAGWLLSPESLVIAGNSAGQMGWLTLPVLAAVALLFGLSGKLLHHPLLPTHTGRELLLLQSLTGTIPAAGLTLASSIPLVVLAATALLVTSGYTFNEVFLYWFPNFGFSFLLLTLLTTLQFFPEKILFKAQICFVVLAAAGLLILSLSGTAGTEKPVTQILQQPSGFSSASSATLLLLFAGSTLTGDRQRPFLIPITAFILFFLWILVSLSYVNPERLASSTVPYMTAARKIMGEPGRQIMGGVVISGTCAAITGLLLMSRRMLGNIVHTKNGTLLLSAKKQRWLFPPLIALSTGILMATGLAGDELLEVLLRGALILWLLYYTLLCLSALFRVKEKTQKIPVVYTLTTLILMAALCTLIISNPHRTEMLTFILTILGTSTLLAAVWFFVIRNTNGKTITQQTEKTV